MKYLAVVFLSSLVFASYLPDTTPSGEGKACNYSIHPAKTCQDGYKCVSEDNALPGASGTCRKKCNGGVLNNCPSGFSCAPEKPGLPGGPGHCLPKKPETPKSKEGESCNYSIHPAKECETGLECYNPKSIPGASGECRKKCHGGVLNNCPSGFSCAPEKPGLPGGPGHCLPKKPEAPKSKEGESCNSSINPPKSCETGLECYIAKPMPGASGECRKKCNGGVLNNCPSGFTCEATTPGLAGGPGHCLPKKPETPKSKEGESCNYSIHPAKECEDGYTCASEDNALLGASGTCRKKCNGGVFKSCPDGFTCKQDQPGLAGGAGACIPSNYKPETPKSKEGESCNSSTNPPKLCADDLACYNGAPIPGAPGECRKKCNGGVRDSCPDGFSCVLSDPPRPGGPGFCLPKKPETPKSKEGESCNSSTNPQKLCDDGLECYIAQPMPGASGQCRKKCSQGTLNPCPSGRTCKAQGNNYRIVGAGGYCLP